MKLSIFLSFFTSALFFSYSCNEDHSDQVDGREIGISNQRILEEGQQLFGLQCSRCHGIDGRGGTAPSLQRPILQYAPDDLALMTIIAGGIPNTEMPGTWLLSENDVQSVAAYVRSLGKIQNEHVKGIASRGKLIYEMKACNTCHIMDGQGIGLGPDLSKVGGRRSATYLRQKLLTPGFDKTDGEVINTADGFIKYLVCEIMTESGEMITGMRMNEDAFSIQLKDAQNRIHSFKKGKIRSYNKVYMRSLMPGVRNLLSDEEIDDLIAYLVSKN
jgi:putative heme-binding domain-containing protein